MGCGASSNTQVSPFNGQPLNSNNALVPNMIAPHPPLTKLTFNQNQSHNRSMNGFVFSSILSCIGNNHSSVTMIGQATNSVEIQTETFGFKLQHTQTDSINMSDEEFQVMVRDLDKELVMEPNPVDIPNDVDANTIDEIDPDEELMQGHKTWRNIIRIHRKEMENKSYCNVAVQATGKKLTKATQTKFGSVDHNFIQKPPKELLSCELCNVFALNCNSDGNPDFNRILSSFDDEDDDEIFSIHHQNNNFKSREAIETNSIEHQNQYSWQSKDKNMQKVQDCLFSILEDIRTKSANNWPQTKSNNVKKRDVSLQTTNDILTDEAPEYAARSPLCSKEEMVPSVLMFRDIDEKMSQAPEFHSTQEMADYVSKNSGNELFKIRALFIWICKNIKFNFKLVEKDSISMEILDQREGTSKDYCRLFGDVCQIMGIRVKKIDGFVRDYDFRPGYHFKPGGDALASWNAVFILNSWRLIDLTLASGYTDASGQFHPKINEHYFLTDPSAFVWTHFPYSNIENNYERWQLLDKPLTLEEFNALPKVNEYFFKYNLSIRSKIQSPLEFRISTEIKIGSHEAMRYKYKLYLSEEMENSSLNYYVFCQLKEDRLIGSFMVQPPMAGRFMLKIFAKTEREMCEFEQDLNITLNPIITMLLECTKARKYIEPFPLNELPWGLTQKFYDFKLKLSNQKGPIIVTWGGRRRLVIEANETMLITYSLYDSDSMEMDTRNIITREDNGFKIIFTINPPRVGTYKFIIFGMPKPKQKGKWRLPLLATFMIDCKMIKPQQHDEDMMPVSHTTDDKNEKKSKNIK